LGSFAKSAAIGALAYGPWFFWAWSYYGSPIPNTVVAKSNPHGAMEQFWLVFDNSPERVLAIAANIFRNVQYGLGFFFKDALSRRLHDATSRCLGTLCFVYWLFPVNDRLGKIASFAFAIVCIYFSYQPETAYWYMPPATMLGLVV